MKNSYSDRRWFLYQKNSYSDSKGFLYQKSNYSDRWFLVQNFIFSNRKLIFCSKLFSRINIKFDIKRDRLTGFFVAGFFSLISSSWSHYRCPRAVLIVSDFSLSYWTFKMTPLCLGHQGVGPKFLG